MRDTLLTQIKKIKVGIVNLDSSNNKGTHWVCYSKIMESIYVQAGVDWYLFTLSFPGAVLKTLSLPLLYSTFIYYII